MEDDVRSALTRYWQRCLLAGLLTVAGSAQGPDQAGRITGRVVDEREQPVPAARVTVLDDRRDIVRAAMSDGTGTFLVKDLPLRCESLVVRVDAKGMAAAEKHARLRWFDPEVAVTLRLRSADTLRGRVLGGDGAPLAGADVVAIQDADPTSTPVSATTDADGRFVLPSLALGSSMLLVVAAGHVAHADEVRLPRGEDLSIRLAHGPGHTLRIRVEGATDEAARSFTAVTTGIRDGDRTARRVVLPHVHLTGAVTTVANLPDGMRWFVVVSGKDPHGPDTFWMARTASGDENATASEILLRVPGPAELTGRVLGPDGEPCAGLHLKARSSVALFGALGVTDAQGEFRMRDPSLPDNALQVYAMDAGWVLDQEGGGRDADNGYGMWGVFSSRDAARPLTLRARRAAIIRGRLVDAEGNGLAAVPMYVYAEQNPGSGDPNRYVWSTTTDADGSFAFHRHAATKDALWLRVGSSTPAVTHGPFRVQGGETRTIDIPAPPTVHHECRIVDATGKPLAGVQVTTRDGQGPWFSDREGRLAFATPWWPDDGALTLGRGREDLAEITVAKAGQRQAWTIRVRER